MRRPSSLVAGALAAGLLAAGTPAAAPAADQRFAVSVIPGGGFDIPLGTMLQRRFHTVIRQQYDFSCGSAALATLLRYHYGVASSETATFDGMWEAGDRAQIRARGFSLLDMKRYLTSVGLNAEGFRVTLDQIAAAGVPGIALTATDGYRHFVVVKGVTPHEVLVGDPSRGLIAYPRARFASMWDGLFFVVTSSPAVGRGSFNSRSQWAGVNRAPLGSALGRPVEIDALRLTTPTLGEF